MRHIINSKDISREEMEELFGEAEKLLGKRNTDLSGKIIATLFFEPSTRTRFSFESAMYRLGGAVITSENARESSSSTKGETIEDTIRTVGEYADAIVMRHYEAGSAAAAAKVSSVPIISAGDGADQHPSQALLDLFTIQKELGAIDGISIAMVGDLKNGRTIKSLLWGLSKFKDVKVTLVSPKGLQLPREYFNELTSSGLKMMETEDLEAIIPEMNVIYQTRIQKERFTDVAEYEKYKGSYRIDASVVSKMKEKSLLLHPLPRVDEISPEVDNMPQAAYFKQVRYGVAVRMALLKWLLK